MGLVQMTTWKGPSWALMGQGCGCLCLYHRQQRKSYYHGWNAKIWGSKISQLLPCLMGVIHYYLLSFSLTEKNWGPDLLQTCVRTLSKLLHVTFYIWMEEIITVLTSELFWGLNEIKHVNTLDKFSDIYTDKHLCRMLV